MLCGRFSFRSLFRPTGDPESTGLAPPLLAPEPYMLLRWALQVTLTLNALGDARAPWTFSRVRTVIFLGSDWRLELSGSGAQVDDGRWSDGSWFGDGFIGSGAQDVSGSRSDGSMTLPWKSTIGPAGSWPTADPGVECAEGLSASNESGLKAENAGRPSEEIGRGETDLRAVGDLPAGRERRSVEAGVD